eukprot:3941961-Rhodomonas_salina.2
MLPPPLPDDDAVPAPLASSRARFLDGGAEILPPLGVSPLALPSGRTTRYVSIGRGAAGARETGI